MQQILNTLYVMTQGSYLHLDHETLKLEVDGTLKLQIPLHTLGGVVLFGNVMVSPFALHRCAEDGRMVVFLDQNGRFKGRMVGPTSGNVLLRKAQIETHQDLGKTLSLVKSIVAGKIQNSRQVVLRGARESDDPSVSEPLKKTGDQLAASLRALEKTDTVDAVRGVEGDAARSYFETFDLMVRANREEFRFLGRNRRPPKDRINAILSFLYALLLNDCSSAVESVGLDPQMGFLHSLRPGRPSLALDLMEEFRSYVADRLALSLINRKQILPDDFEERPGGAIWLGEKGRKEVVVAYQKRKQEEVTHSLLNQKIPLGLVPQVQARLLARYLRGDMGFYPPYVAR